MAKIPQNSISRRKVVIITTFGNVVEWFDFTVYGFLAVVIAANFFPSADPTASLLASLATFGIGFGARPLGAILLGRLGDRLGRRFILLMSMVLMATSSLVIGSLPTHERLGIWSAVIVVCARVLQGLSAGGEFGNAIAYLIEWAPPSRRGLFGSFHQIGSAGGLLAGSMVAAVLQTSLSPAEIASWGWRVPFLLGGTLAVIAYALRRSLPETPEFAGRAQVPSTLRQPVLKPTLQTIGIVALWTVSVFAAIVYMPTYTTQHGGLTAQQALWTTTLALLVLLIVIPFAGHVSDSVGRRPIILAAAVLFALGAPPAFFLLSHGLPVVAVGAIQVVFAIGAGLASGVGPVTIGELFSVRQRSTWTSIGSAIAVTLFGGFAPFIATLLIARTGDPASPGWFVTAIAVLTGATALTLPSGPRRVGTANPALTTKGIAA